MSKSEWKKYMDNAIDELIKIKVPGKQGEIKNKLAGLLKKMKAIGTKPQRGGTIETDENGKDRYRCDYQARSRPCRINNGLGEGIIWPNQVQRYGRNPVKHYHFTCYMNKLNSKSDRRERSTRRRERSKSRERYYKKKTEQVEEEMQRQKRNEEAEKEKRQKEKELADKELELKDIELQRVSDDLRASRWGRILDYIYGLGTITVGGMTSYTSYHVTALATGYLLQFAMAGFPSWSSYQLRKADEWANLQHRNYQADLDWRIRHGIPVPTPRPDDRQLAIGCDNPNSFSCRWNSYWGNYAEITNEGHLALPEIDPTGQLDQTAWETFVYGARQFWEQGRNAGEQFWRDITYNPGGAFETIGSLGDVIWQIARLVDNVIPIVVAFWIFHFFATKALDIANRQNNNNNNKKKPDSGGRKRRKRTRRKRKRKRKKTRRKRRR